MAANKPGKAEILAAFFDDGTYSPLFTDGAVSAAYGCAGGSCPHSAARTPTVLSLRLCYHRVAA